MEVNPTTGDLTWNGVNDYRPATGLAGFCGIFSSGVHVILGGGQPSAFTPISLGREGVPTGLPPAISLNAFNSGQNLNHGISLFDSQTRSLSLHSTQPIILISLTLREIWFRMYQYCRSALLFWRIGFLRHSKRCGICRRIN